MAFEPPNMEVFINKVAVKTFARPYYRKLVKSMELKGNEKILDYGSGPAGPAIFIAKELKNGGGLLTCVDVSEKWLTCAKSTLSAFSNVDFKLGNIGELTIEDNSYDIINVHFVLHDISKTDWTKIIPALVSKLKKGGKVLLREPEIDNSIISDLTKAFEKQGMKRMHKKEVKVPLSPKSYEIWLKKA